MDLGKDDAAAEVRPGCVHLAVVLVRVPSRQIFPNLDPNGDDTADGSLIEEGGSTHETRMEPQLIADQANELARFHEVDELPDPIEVRREGLLDEDARPGSRPPRP